MGGVISVLRIFSKRQNMKTIIVLLVCVAFAAVQAQQIAQEMTLMDGTNQAFFQQNCNALNTCRRGWNNNQGNAFRISGMWCFYDRYNYNPTGKGDSECFIGYNSEQLGFLFNTNGDLSSFRHVGRRSDIRVSTLNLYTRTYYEGPSLTTGDDVLHLDGALASAQSAIITGTDGWRIYSCPDLGEEQTNCISTCLQGNTDGFPLSFPELRNGIFGQPPPLGHQIVSIQMDDC